MVAHLLRYPSCCSHLCLNPILITVLITIGHHARFVNISGRSCTRCREGRSRSFYVLRHFLPCSSCFLVWANPSPLPSCIPGTKRAGLTLPHERGWSLHCSTTVRTQAVGDIWGSFRRFHLLWVLMVTGDNSCHLRDGAGACLPAHFHGIWGLLFYSGHHSLIHSIQFWYRGCGP